MGAGGETILLVEDHANLRSLLRGLLERCGYMVLEAEDGLAGLQAAAAAGPIDLLVTDVSMPRLSGSGMARRLAEQRPGLKVLFTSIHALADDDLTGIGSGAVQFLPKPFTGDELTKKVRQMLAIRAPADTPGE